jgi:hypothetical protein
VRDRVRRLHDTQVRSVAAPGMAKAPFLSSFGIANTWATGIWITLVTLFLLLMAACTGWIGRRRSRMAGATDYRPTKPGFLGRFRRF